MNSYNLGKAADRARYRQDRVDELAAIKAGVWPRDINDATRWIYDPSPEYAARMCQSAINYIDGLEVRIATGEVAGEAGPERATATLVGTRAEHDNDCNSR
jgi:hypothetical protein